MKLGMQSGRLMIQLSLRLRFNLQCSYIFMTFTEEGGSWGQWWVARKYCTGFGAAHCGHAQCKYAGTWYHSGRLLNDSIVFTNTGLQISRLVLTVSESILFPITDLVISLKHCYFHWIFQYQSLLILNVYMFFHKQCTCWFCLQKQSSICLKPFKACCLCLYSSWQWNSWSVCPSFWTRQWSHVMRSDSSVRRKGPANWKKWPTYYTNLYPSVIMR